MEEYAPHQKYNSTRIDLRLDAEEDEWQTWKQQVGGRIGVFIVVLQPPIDHKGFTTHEPCKEEFSDWPDGLLAIGTFGNSTQWKEEIGRHDGFEKHDPYSTSQDASQLQLEDQKSSDITKEEVGKLQKELIKLLSRKPADDDAVRLEDGGGEKLANLPLDKFLNCPSSLDVDRINCIKFLDSDLDVAAQDACIKFLDSDLDVADQDGGEHPRNNSVVLSKGKDVRADKKNVIRQRSLKFLLGKIFACRGGFEPTPSLRDSFPESRMEKLLRTMLHKNIYPQSSASSSSRKYLPSKHIPKTRETADERPKEAKEGYKWDKSDSEFIVLEI
ncbi:hypothetical protein ACLOJK_025184 [Asimina triloba]